MVVTRPTNASALTIGTQPIFFSAIIWAISLIGASGAALMTRFFITSLIGTLLSKADLLLCLRPKTCAAAAPIPGCGRC